MSKGQSVGFVVRCFWKNRYGQKVESGLFIDTLFRTEELAQDAIDRSGYNQQGSVMYEPFEVFIPAEDITYIQTDNA